MIRAAAIAGAGAAAMCAAACGSCGSHDVITATEPVSLGAHTDVALDSPLHGSDTTSSSSSAASATPPSARRMVPAEAYLRSYLTWFGGLAPAQVAQRAHAGELFSQWNDYLGAIGLPDYRIDSPRAETTNTVMLATLGRLGEALCIRAVEHDLGGAGHGAAPSAQRIIFAFEPGDSAKLAEFAPRFDVLHRTFLGYPVALAPADRAPKFFALYQKVAAAHADATELTASESAWAAVCTALIQHPEAELY